MSRTLRIIIALAAALCGFICVVRAACDFVLSMFGCGSVAGRRGRGYSAVYVSGGKQIEKWAFTAAAGLLLTAAAVSAFSTSRCDDGEGQV